MEDYKQDLKEDRNTTLVSEANRVFELYMTDQNKQKFVNRVKPLLEANDISDYFFTKDYELGEILDKFGEMPFTHAKAIFDEANAIMAEDHITKRFAETMQKANSSRLTKDYPSYFPEQLPSGFDLYSPEPKAEGGVIGLKDKAVNMYRNKL